MEGSQKSGKSLKAASSLSEWSVTSGDEADLKLNRILNMDVCMKRNVRSELGSYTGKET